MWPHVITNYTFTYSATPPEMLRSRPPSTTVLPLNLATAMYLKIYRQPKEIPKETMMNTTYFRANMVSSVRPKRLLKRKDKRYHA